MANYVKILAMFSVVNEVTILYAPLPLGCMEI